MFNLSNNTLIALVVVLLVVTVVLSVLVSKSKCKCNSNENYSNKKESFCVCTGKTKRQVDLPKLKDAYRSGKRTEYTDLAAIQEANGGAKWPKLSGAGYNRPFSEYETPTPKCS